ncbi:MAG: hypothetical protein WC799_24600 [Desulfobacteraceae bacterium]|jgi:hypothetical protein
MMNMKNALNSICFICMIFFLGACSTHLKEINIVSEKPGPTILIAGDSSSFKDKVRERIIEKYKPTCTIHVVNVADLKEKTADSYDVVLIMDTCMAWSSFNPSLKAFMDSEENRKKTVLSMTAGDPDWTYSYKGVDAITSASRVAKEDDFFNRIDKDIERVLALAKQ